MFGVWLVVHGVTPLRRLPLRDTFADAHLRYCKTASRGRLSSRGGVVIVEAQPHVVVIVIFKVNVR